jgi:hypothetical protein
VPASASTQIPPQVKQGDFLALLFRPLLSPQAAAFLLECSVDHVVRMADASEVVACNVALKIERGDEAVDERAPERMIRILRPSIERLVIPAYSKQGGKCPEPTFEQALDSVHHRATWTRREVTHFLDCSDDHVRRLTEAKLLGGPLLTQTGSGRLQHIARASLGEFLRDRDLSQA